jgi:hypothetical protein
MNDGIPYKEHNRYRMNYFMPTTEGYMKIKFCDTCREA